jgi:hypothetical protein
LRWKNSIFYADNDDDETSYLALSKATKEKEELSEGALID